MLTDQRRETRRLNSDDSTISPAVLPGRPWLFSIGSPMCASISGPSQSVASRAGERPSCRFGAAPSTKVRIGDSFAGCDYIDSVKAERKHRVEAMRHDATTLEHRAAPVRAEPEPGGYERASLA